MHTVVFGWFGVSALWFVPLALRLVIAAVMRDALAGGRGKIRLWLGFAGVFVGSGVLEAALAPHTGNALGHAVLGVALRALGHGAFVVAPLLVLAGLPWLMGFSWRGALRWADRAFGLGLNMGPGAASPRNAAGGTRDDEPRMVRGGASGNLSGSVIRTTTTNAMAPKATGRYARPTVWQPPPGSGTKARTVATPGTGRSAPRDPRGVNGKPLEAATPARSALPSAGWSTNDGFGGARASRPAPAVASGANTAGGANWANSANARVRHSVTTRHTTAPAAQGHHGATSARPSVAGSALTAAANYAGARAAQATAAVAAAPSAQAASVASLSSLQSGLQSGSPSAGLSASHSASHPGLYSAEQSTEQRAPNAWPQHPARPAARMRDIAHDAAVPPEPSPGVLETLKAIEANAAQWTALAGSSLARRGAAATAPRSPVAGQDAPGHAGPRDTAQANERLSAGAEHESKTAQHGQPASAPITLPGSPVGYASEDAQDTPDSAAVPDDTPPRAASTPPWVESEGPHDAPMNVAPAADMAPAAHAPPPPAVPVLPELASAEQFDAPTLTSTSTLRSTAVSTREPTALAVSSASIAQEPPSAPGTQASAPPLPFGSAPAEPGATAETGATGTTVETARTVQTINTAQSPSPATECTDSTPEPATAAPAATPLSLPPAAPPAAQPQAAPPTPAADASARPALRGHAPTEFTFHAPAASRVELPSLALLEPASTETEDIPAERLAQTGQLIEQRLQEFKVPVAVVGASAGPVITRFEIEPALGVRGSQIVGLMKDLSRGLGLTSIRVVETIPGRTCMGLELPNAKRQTIRLSEILAAAPYQNSASKLTLAMGKDITGHPIVTDLAKAPHMLVAGTTGSGKSVAINAMIVSLLFKATPEEVRLIMIDPKMLELSVYEGIPHLLAPVVTDMKLAANALNWCVGEMEKRYRLMSAVGVRNLAGFNQKLRDAQAAGKKIGNPFSLTPEAPEPLSPLPLIVVVIDELADLMMVAGKKIEDLIARLAQKARAAGIHLILATQRPSVDVITGLIKANIPTRVAFQVSSKIDSRTILDQMGAESLLGQGDMLFLPPGTGYPQRVHGAFVADEEVHRVVEHLKQFGEPEYEEGILDGPAAEGAAQDLFGDAPDAEADPLYDEAVAFVIRTRRASISAVQRQLRIGYNRAARLVEQMEAAGLVSSMGINGSREVIAPPSSEP